jgi:hypothetical protein
MAVSRRGGADAVTGTTHSCYGRALLFALCLSNKPPFL